MSLLTLAEIEASLQDTGGVQVAFKGTTTWGRYQIVMDEEDFGGEGPGANVGVQRPSVIVPTQAISAKTNDRLTLTADAALALGWTTKKVVILWRDTEPGDGSRTRLWLAEA